MYLSRLIISLRSREARHDLADRYELHRTLLRVFPQALPEDERILYRVEDQLKAESVAVLVQSQEMPQWEQADRLSRPGYLNRPPDVRQVVANFQAGRRLRFRLQANPTVKRDGKRHALYADEELFAWLMRKGEAHGFVVDTLDVCVAKLGKKHGKKQSQTWHAVQFDGVLTITQAHVFNDALVRGIGSAKAFGFGLLSIPYGNA